MTRALLLLFTLGLPSVAFAMTYEVGPGQAYRHIGDVPLESLNPGDIVQIHVDPAGYHEKWVIARAGAPNAPIIFRGVPDDQGNLPLIDGQNATTRTQLDYWSEVRGIIKIGGSSTPSQSPTYVTVEKLHIRHARNSYTFTSHAGQTMTYGQNASAIFVEEGTHLTIRDCEIEDNGNGLFVAYAAADVHVEGNYIHGNGNVDSIYEHNSYTEAQGITFDHNRYGPLCTGCPGNALKDRSSGTVIRYNWIESGNRQLDLVDSDHAEEYNAASYANTYVYGNLLIEPDGAGNRQIVHFGGDSGGETNYRKTLYFWNNTIVSTRTDRTTWFLLDTNAQTAYALNNIVYASAGNGTVSFVDDAGQLFYGHNWITSGIVGSFGGPVSGTLTDQGGNVTGTNPGFVSLASQDFHLAPGSPALNAAGALPSPAEAFALSQQYVKHQQLEARPGGAHHNIGALDPASPGTASSSSTSSGTTAGSSSSTTTTTGGHGSSGSTGGSAGTTAGSSGSTGGSGSGAAGGSSGTTGGGVSGGCGSTGGAGAGLLALAALGLGLAYRRRALR